MKSSFLCRRWPISSSFYRHLCLLLIILCGLPMQPQCVLLLAHPPPALFIFGDSLADVGNNNYLPLSLLKGNYLPNGVDYLHRIPTGRFCNGRLLLDFIASRLGFAESLPYLSPQTKGAAILQGVNYASAGCGILNETSRNANNCLPFSMQLKNFENTLLSIVQQLGIDNANSFLSSSLYFIIIGSNDFLGNYARSNSADSETYTPQQFNDLLVSSLSQQLTFLYNLSARKMVVTGLGPLGCIPAQRVKISTGACNEQLNDWVFQLNAALQALVQDLGSKLVDAKITFANPYSIVTDIIHNATTYGFNQTSEACCGGGRMRAQIPCIPLSMYCSDRSNQFFWDPWHPTEAANSVLANSLLSASTSVVGPWSITELALAS